MLFGANIDAVRDDLDNGQDVNVLDEDGDTYLHHAAWCDSYDVVELLLQRGANIHMLNDLGYTPLDDSLTTPNFNIMDLLIEYAEKTNGLTK